MIPPTIDYTYIKSRKSGQLSKKSPPGMGGGCGGGRGESGIPCPTISSRQTLVSTYKFSSPQAGLDTMRRLAREREGRVPEGLSLKMVLLHLPIGGRETGNPRKMCWGGWGTLGRPHERYLSCLQVRGMKTLYRSPSPFSSSTERRLFTAAGSHADVCKCLRWQLLCTTTTVIVSPAHVPVDVKQPNNVLARIPTDVPNLLLYFAPYLVLFTCPFVAPWRMHH